MNEGQEKFCRFILDRVTPARADEAKALLAENFRRQDEGTFTADYLPQAVAALMAVVKPECHDDLRRAAAQMSPTLGR